jgi:peroxiredoxin
MKKTPRRRKAKSAHLLGLGLDNSDGHKRLTSAEQFTIVGGSDETHTKMTETVIKTFEVLKRRGKSLHGVEPQELAEIIHKSTPR